MRTAGERHTLVLSLLAFMAAFAACARRPLPERDDGGVLDPADARPDGQIGTSCSEPRLDLVGNPLLLLDTPPPTVGNLYTSLVWTGAEYLFVWRIYNGDAVLMQRIDASGQAVGGNIRLRSYENAFDVVWAGSRLAAVWTRGESNGERRDLMFQTFDGLGRPLIDAVPLRSSVDLPFDGGVSYGPRIAAFGGGFAIVWREGEVFVATVGVDGNLLHQPVVAGGSDLHASPELTVAATDDRILVGWTSRRTPSSPVSVLQNAMVVRSFSGTLMPLGSAVDLDDAGFPRPQQLLATESGFIALWSHGALELGVAPDDIPVRVAHLPGTGTTAAIGTMAAPVVGPYRELAPAVWNRDHLVVVWDGRSENGLTLSRFALGGVRQGESINLPTRAPASRLYAVAHDGVVGFIWSEEVDRGYQVYFQQARSCP